MESFGINFGYLIMQIIGMAVCVTVFVGIGVYVLRLFLNNKERGEKVMTLPVAAEGVTIPAELLPKGGRVEVWRDGEQIIIKQPKS